jgi:CAAX protease family protein
MLAANIISQQEIATSVLAVGVLTMALNIVCNTFWLTWLFAHTRSVLLCLLFHAATNTANMLFVLMPAELVAGIAYQAIVTASTATLLVSVVALVIATRGRLGYAR